MTGSTRSAKRQGKEVVVESDSDDKYIDVNNELSDDDDFVVTGGSNANVSGLRRSGRKKQSESMEAGSTAGKAQKQERKRVREPRMLTTGKKVDSDKPLGVKKQKKGKKVASNNTSAVLQTRSSPRALCNAILQLKPNQKACLEDIGFKGLVDFKVDGIPSRLGMYVVSNFDEDKMEIKLANGSLLVTKELIGDMLGLKNEGSDLLEGKANRNEEMVRSWLEQYGNDKEIKPTDIKIRLRNSEEADMNFKLNFIVLFASIMGNIRIGGVCDLTILDYISPNTNLSNINWCEYVWRSLKTCKTKWTMGKKDCYFCGPLTLLTMIYVDGTKSPTKIVCRRRPPTKVWTAELLSEREAEELNFGGFGLGELEEEFVEEEDDPIPNNIEGCMWMLKKHLSNITCERKGFEKLLKATENMFPGNVNLVGINDMYINVLKHTSDGNYAGTNSTMHRTEENENDVEREGSHRSMNVVETVSDIGMQLEGNEDVEAGASNTKVQTPGLVKELREEERVVGFGDPENLCGLLTQEAFISAAEKVDRSIEISNILERDDGPSYSLGVTQDFALTPMVSDEAKVLTPVPISAYRPDVQASDVFLFHGKRVASISNIGRSPYFERVVDIDVSLNSDELKVSKYLFQTGHDSDTKVLFKGISGQQSTRFELESLGQDYVLNNILDTWAEVRNYMEKYKSKESPLRLFLPTFVVVKDTFGVLRHDDVRFKTFVDHVESVTGKDSEMKSLKKIDVVFLPIDNEGHRFMIVFDLKYGAVMVFDQMKNVTSVRKSKIRKGGKIGNTIVAEMLHEDFGRYLYGLGHSKASNMINADLEFGEYDWQTATVKPHAGFFLMRIMEVYMGKGIRNWDLRLKTNRGSLKKHLTILCKKYAATILFSDCNMLKDFVRAEIENATSGMSGVPLIK